MKIKKQWASPTVQKFRAPPSDLPQKKFRKKKQQAACHNGTMTIYPSSSQEAKSSNQEKQELKQSNMSS